METDKALEEEDMYWLKVRNSDIYKLRNISI